MTPLELVQSTSPALNAAGASTYFHPENLAAGQEIGLKGFPFYFLGRGGVMGDVDAMTIASAFGWFHPDLVANVWNKWSPVVRPTVAAEAFLRSSGAIARKQLGDVSALDEFSEAAEAVRAAVSPAGLPLYAGIDAQPMPSDSIERAYQNVLVLRELRGSFHLVAVVASGVPAGVAHTIRRPGDGEAFGWVESPEATDEHRAALIAAEAMTDELLVPAFSTLAPAQADALGAGATAIHEAFDQSSRFANRG